MRPFSLSVIHGVKKGRDDRMDREIGEQSMRQRRDLQFRVLGGLVLTECRES